LHCSKQEVKQDWICYIHTNVIRPVCQPHLDQWHDVIRQTNLIRRSMFTRSNAELRSKLAMIAKSSSSMTLAICDWSRNERVAVPHFLLKPCLTWRG
jgi:hypothetical protein